MLLATWTAWCYWDYFSLGGARETCSLRPRQACVVPALISPPGSVAFSRRTTFCTAVDTGTLPCACSLAGEYWPTTVSRRDPEVMRTFRRSSGFGPEVSVSTELPQVLSGLLRHVDAEDIPASGDLMSCDELERDLTARREDPFSLVAVGDIMLGGRLRRVIAEQSEDYPFAGVRPLLRRAKVLVGNLEGPFAQVARRQERNFSYRIPPHLAGALARAGFRGVTLANNHLLDCGREGVLETLEALEAAGVAPLGAGRDHEAAHEPRIFEAGARRVGLLAYYWNRRTAATSRLPGSALDTRSELEADIRALRRRVDHLVAFFHWGVPYVREPAPEDREKA